MTNVCKNSRLKMHGNYERLADLTCDSHERGRTPSGIDQADIALARLYSHAFRGHVIGAFHAAREAVKRIEPSDRAAAVQLTRVDEMLGDLANRSMDTVGQDARALISTFHHYCTHVARTVSALDAACEWEENTALNEIRNRFVGHMERITASNGLYLTRDTGSPEQGCFVVPNLGITIVPLVYGDHHSWNLAWLDGQRSDVPYHRHREGVEIHLGYAPFHGFTVLGDAKAEIRESYAMPIPPETRHGFTNIGAGIHHVPFIFGSLSCGGWGVFLDVEPMPCELDQLETVAVHGRAMNGAVSLDREIARAADRHTSVRYPIIPAERTDRTDVGGLELSVVRAWKRGFVYRLDRFAAVSVVRGCGLLIMANEQIELTPHDHFGIPAGIPAEVVQTGSEPLVLLDAVLRATDSRNRW